MQIFTQLCLDESARIRVEVIRLGEQFRIKVVDEGRFQQ